MPRSRHQSTTLRRCSGGSTRPVGFDGELSHSSARRARGRARSASRWPPRGRPPAPRPPRTSGRRAPGRRPGRRRRGRGGPASDAISSFEPITGSTWSRPRPVTPCDDASQSSAACRVATRGRSSPGSPGESAAAAQRLAGPPRASGRPAYRPRGRRCRPGAPGARAAWAASLSQGKSGRREETLSGGYSSCSCGGSAATSGWSWSISPILAAPPGDPRSSKKWTLAS